MPRWLIIALVSVLFVASAPALAQQIDPERHEDIEARVEQAKQRLNLTDEQVEQIKPVIKSNAEATKRILESHGIDLSVPKEQRNQPSMREMRALGKDMKALRLETTEQMAAILTDEQFEEFLTMQEERRDEMRDKIRAKR